MIIVSLILPALGPVVKLFFTEYGSYNVKRKVIFSFSDKTAAEKTEVPKKISRKWLLVYQILEKIKLAGTAQCNVKFYADLKDFKQNEMAAEISLPEIRYNHLDLKGIQEKITLKNGIFSIEQFSAQLGSGTEFTSGICYQNDKKSFSGQKLYLLPEKVAITVTHLR